MSLLAHLEPGFRVAVHAVLVTPSTTPMVTLEIQHESAPTFGLVLDPEMARSVADLLIASAANAERLGQMASRHNSGDAAAPNSCNDEDQSRV